MTNFFERKDRWGHGLALWVLVAMVFVTPLCWWSLKQTKLENDVENWLPEDDPQAVTLDWYRSHFPPEDTLFVTWDGSSVNDPRIELLAHKLEGVTDEQGRPRNGSRYVKGVSTPKEALERIVDSKVDEEEAFRRLQGILIGRGPIKIKLSDAGLKRKKQTRAELKQAARDQLGLDLFISGAFEPAEVDLSDEDEALLERLAAERAAAAEADGEEPFEIYRDFPAHDLQVSWRGIDYQPEKVEQFFELAQKLHSPGSPNLPDGEPLIESSFFYAGTPVAVLVNLSEAGQADKREAMEEIRQTVVACGVPDEKIHMGGRAVANAALNAEVLKAGWNRDFPVWQLHHRSPILLSGLVGVILAYVMLRSFRLATLVLLVSYYTIYVSMSLVPVTGGSMNMVLVVMPTLLLVLTISAAIHVANYWKHAANHNPARAVVQAVEMARKPCMLASITTAIGLLSLATSPLAPVKDFGFYSAAGCLISLAVVLYGLPSLIQFWPAPAGELQNLDSRPWRELGRFLSRHHMPVTAVCILAGIVCSVGLKDFRTETKAIKYFPDHAPVVQDYHFIEENLAGIVPVDTIIRFDASAREDLKFLDRLEIVRRIEAEIRKHPEVSGAISLADFRPVTEFPAEDAGRLEQLNFHRMNTAIEEEVLRGRARASARRFISPAVDELAEGEEEGAGEAEPAEAGHGQHKYAKSNPDDELWRITAQVAIMSDLDYADLTQDINRIAEAELKLHPGTRHIVTGMVPIFLRTQQAVLESLIQSFGIAFVVIGVVMIFVLKDVPSGVITMIPNILPVGVVFGLISWYGLSVDIGTMITASVALGMAVDGTLHLLNWFRKGIAEGKSREESVAMAMGHCGPAMWQTSAAVGLGLFMLYWAELLLVSRFGWLMAALIGAALIGDLILLPALLAGPLGKLIQKSMSSETPSSTAAPTHEQPPQVPQPHLQKFTRLDAPASRNDPGISPTP